MSNILLIHIGMPKTGTTALQNFLLVNNDKLEKYGWCYPILNDGQAGELERLELSDIKKSGNGCWLYRDWILNNLKSEWDKGMEIVLRHLNNKNVIISAEDIYDYGMEKFITDAKEKYKNIKVMVYLRRQDRAIESRYSQWIKSQNECSTFEEFIDSDTVPKDWLRYVLRLDLISRIIGKENLIVRIYEKQQLAGNDIITDFLAAFGIPLDQDEWKKGERGNFSLRGNYLEISRLINSAQKVDNILESRDGIWSWSDWEVRNAFQDVCEKLSCSFGGDRGESAFFTSDGRKEFLEKFASDNERIAREYLHREDGILFYDERMDYPILEINQSSNFEADMIRVFTAMIYAQEQRFRHLLEIKSNEIIGRLFVKEALRRSKNRELLFWGAGHNCRRLLDMVGGVEGAFIVDNDVSKRGSCLYGVQVKYAGDIAVWEDYFVAVTCEETAEIEEQLRGLGFKREEDYILMREYDL